MLYKYSNGQNKTFRDGRLLKSIYFLSVKLWKVLNTYYPGKELSYFEPYPALCQQYLFSMARFIKL